jgi:hypothetical protein
MIYLIIACVVFDLIVGFVLSWSLKEILYSAVFTGALLILARLFLGRLEEEE